MKWYVSVLLVCMGMLGRALCADDGASVAPQAPEHVAVAVENGAMPENILLMFDRLASTGLASYLSPQYILESPSQAYVFPTTPVWFSFVQRHPFMFGLYYYTMKDVYRALLGLPVRYTKQDVDEAFRALVDKYHLDVEKKMLEEHAHDTGLVDAPRVVLYRLLEKAHRGLTGQ